MNRHRFMLVGLLLIASLALTACPQPDAMVVEESDTAATTDDSAAASEDAEVAPDNIVAGGTWTRSTSADATILNPILGSDSASSDIYGQIFPALIGQDPFSGELVAGFGSLAESIDVSDDGLVYTFNLRDDMLWSDGEQVDANDFKYTYDAIASDNVETVRKPNVEFIEEINVIDDFTVEVTFTQVKCDAIADVGLGLLPSHLYAEDFSDVMDSPLNEEPSVSAGPMEFQSWTRDDNTILVRNDDYVLGAPNLDGMIYRIVPDPGARLAQLQSGEVDFTGVQPEQVEVVESDDSLNLFNAFDDGYTYIGLNLANPDNPQPGQDEDGEIIEQEPHPILSDQQVRLAHGPRAGLSDDYRQRLPRPGLPDCLQRAARRELGL